MMYKTLRKSLVDGYKPGSKWPRRGLTPVYDVDGTLQQMNFPVSTLRAATMAALVATLFACATTAPEDTPEPSTPQRNLPDVELTPELAYDILLADIARQRGHREVAADAAMRAARASRDPRLVEYATRLAIQAKRRDEAIESARLWIELEPENALAYETLAALHVVGGNLAEAKIRFEEAIALHGSDVEAAFRRITKLLLQIPDRSAAASLLQELVASHQQSAEAQLALARVAGDKQPDIALAAVDRALALQPGLEEAAIFKSQLLVVLGRYDDNISFCNAYLDQNPRARNLRLHFARTLLDQHKNELAREQFREAAEADPDDADAAFATGLLLIEAHEYSEAERYLERALAINPGNDQARLYLGQLAGERKDYGKAISWYREISSAQYAFEAQLRMAAAEAARGEVDAAVAQLDALQPGTDAERVQLVLARQEIYRDAKRLQDAMNTLNDALADTPKEEDLLYARALLAAEMKQLDVHERDIRQVLAMSPENANALNALGYTLADQTDRYAEAEELIARALALKPEDPYILDSMGWVNYRLGKNDVALDYLRRAFEHRPDAEIAAHLGEVLWITGDRAAARKVWRDGLKLAPDNETLQQTVERLDR